VKLQIYFPTDVARTTRGQCARSPRHDGGRLRTRCHRKRLWFNDSVLASSLRVLVAGLLKRSATCASGGSTCRCPWN